MAHRQIKYAQHASIKASILRKPEGNAIVWPKHDGTTLGDLVERLEGMPKEDQTTVWDLIDAWSSDAQTDDKVKAVLRERIRRFALTRLGRRRGLEEATRDRAREVYTKNPPADRTVFDLIEFAYEFIAQPSDPSYHSYMSHSHYSYDRDGGRERFT